MKLKVALSIATAATLYASYGFAQPSQAQPEQQRDALPKSAQAQSESQHQPQTKLQMQKSSPGRQSNQQDTPPCVGPVSFCNIYFGS